MSRRLTRSQLRRFVRHLTHVMREHKCHRRMRHAIREALRCLG